jgi:hypothetical protein
LKEHQFDKETKKQKSSNPFIKKKGQTQFMYQRSSEKDELQNNLIIKIMTCPYLCATALRTNHKNIKKEKGKGKRKNCVFLLNKMR